MASVSRRVGIARLAGTVALVLALTTACGSTVSSRTAPGPAPPQPEGQLTGPDRQTTGAAPPTLSPAGATAVPVARDSDRPGATTEVSSAERVASLAVPGVTSSTITFGVTFATDVGQASSAAGADDVDPGDVRSYYNAVVKDVNRSGGVAGRRLVPAYYETSTTSSESADSQRGAACQHWIHDTKAFVVLDATSEVLRSCAERNRMVALSGGGNSISSTFTRYPHYLEPSGLGLDSLARATASGLARTDYYGKAPVIGVLTWDNPQYRAAITDGLVPELAKLGFRAKVVSYAKVPESYADAGGTSASVSSAVLKFRQEGVTHAFILDGPAGLALGTVLTLLWIKGASSQRYYPRYGFNDLNSPQAGLDAGLWRPDDVRGARVVTANNADDKTDLGVTKNRSRIACLALMRRHGMSPSNLNAQGFMLRACDYVWFIRAVLGTARAPVHRDRFVALAEQLGTSFRSPVAYRTELSPLRHDGIAGFRRQALDDACDCYKYISGIYPR